MARKKDPAVAPAAPAPPASSAPSSTPPALVAPAAEGADKRLPAHQRFPMSVAMPASYIAIETGKLEEIAALLWFPAGISEEKKHAKLIRAADLINSLKPTDGLEAMLAMQMVGTHTAASECLRRAMDAKASSEVRNANLTQSQRLMDLYLRQVAALNKHRGNGQQKVTVEHVHVASGGQAIVGNIGGGTAAPPQLAKPEGYAEQAMLPAPDQPLPLALDLQKVPAQSRVL